MRRLGAWAPALLWMALIFVVSHQPAVPLPGTKGADKVAHAAAYAVLGALLSRGARASGTHPAWGVAAGLLYGLLDEVHQSFVPGRSPDVADWAADAVGVLLGTLAHTRGFRR